MRFEVSVDIEELERNIPGGIIVGYSITQAEFDRLVKAGVGYQPREGLLRFGRLEFVVKPSITAELDRLLAQREFGSTSDRFLMSREVFNQFKETGIPLRRGSMLQPDYKGVLIDVRDEVEGGVQLRCDYYIKGGLS